MRVFFLICFAFLFSLSARAAFIPATDDIPLMDGITLPETNDFSFDTPAGQILIFEGETKQSPNAIRAFYAESLIALGWSWQQKDLYVRGKDTFGLSFPAPNRVRFDIMLNNTAN